MDRRFVVGLTAGLLFIFFYYWILLPWFFPQMLQRPQAPGGAAPETPAEPTAFVPFAEPQAAQPARAAESRQFHLERGPLRARLASRGAVLVALEVQLDGQWVPLLTEAAGPHFVLVDAQERAPLDTADWEAQEIEGGVRFTYEAQGGWTIRKNFTLDEGRGFALELGWENPKDAAPVAFEHRLSFGGIERDGPYRYTTYLAALLQEGGQRGLDWVYHGKVRKRRVEMELASLGLVGLKNRYFAVLLAPDLTYPWCRRVIFQNASFGPADGHDEEQESIRVTLAGEPFTLEGHQVKTARFLGFAGPIRADALGAQAERLGRETGGLLDYSGPNWLGRAILGLLHLGWALTGNYGWAIIVATLVLRALLLPLSYKGQVTMLKMQGLQGEMRRLQETYGKDPRRLLEEQRELYRRHKLNPASGCLPLLIQLPIFIAIYSVLDISVELRHATFLWISDLTQPDRLVRWAAPLDLGLFQLDSLNILPIVMTATWIYQAVTAPRSETNDPNVRLQRRIMMLMPPVFGLICYSLASGLSLYFFVNALWSIAEQKIIRVRFEKRAGK